MKMKSLALAFFGLVLSLPAFGWNCTGNNIRVQVPTGTKGTGTGDAPGNVVVDSGLTFECEPPTPVTPPTTPSTSNNTSNSTSSANSASNSASNSTSGASATGGNSSSKSGVSNSGNSTNNNTINSALTGGNQKQGQTQSNSAVNSNQSAGGSVSNVGNSVENIEAPKIPVNTAVAPPVFSTTNCFKGYSAGGQTAVAGLSFGGGGIDKNCAAERAAQNYFASGNRLAFCKVMVTLKASKDAGVTLADCLNVPVIAPRAVVAPVAQIAPPVQVEITNNIPPAPAPIILHEEMTVTASRQDVARAQPQQKKRIAHRPCPVTPLQNACPVREK